LIGIDTETKPAFRKGQRNPTALIQIAVRNSSGAECAFIVDILHMSKKQQARLNEILKPVFNSSDVYKLGHSLKQDILELKRAYPHMDAFHVCRGILDTNNLFRYMNPEVQRNISLRDLVRNYLHFELSKKCQMSNWAARPLSAEQQHYAACDALVLLRLYDVMTCEADEREVEWKNAVFDVGVEDESAKVTTSTTVKVSKNDVKRPIKADIEPFSFKNFYSTAERKWHEMQRHRSDSVGSTGSHSGREVHVLTSSASTPLSTSSQTLGDGSSSQGKLGDAGRKRKQKRKKTKRGFDSKIDEHGDGSTHVDDHDIRIPLPESIGTYSTFDESGNVMNSEDRMRKKSRKIEVRS
jgi:hypothetical protein